MLTPTDRAAFLRHVLRFLGLLVAVVAFVVVLFVKPVIVIGTGILTLSGMILWGLWEATR